MKVCGPLVPPAVETVTVRGPTAAAGSSTKLAVSEVPATHDDVVDRHAGAADGHRRGADDEVGTRQRDRHRGAIDALIRRDAGQRRGARRWQIDREGLSTAGPAGRRDRDCAGTHCCGRIETKLAVSDVVLPTTTVLTVTPPPATATVVPPTTKLVPVSVTATAVPRTP